MFALPEYRNGMVVLREVESVGKDRYASGKLKGIRKGLEPFEIIR